jgi:cell wall-associated NlpC family hydrolase
MQNDGNMVSNGPNGPIWSIYANGGVSKLAASGAVAFARKQLGKPYRWGATGPDAYDCSGLTQASYANVPKH